MDHLPPETRLERLRRFRNWARPSLSLEGQLQREAKELERLRRSVGGVGRAWAAVLPGHLASRCELVGVKRGVLTIRVGDDGARYELDRWLRSGGELALIRASTTTVRRVKLLASGQ